jgi:Rieske Fe-S protein
MNRRGFLKSVGGSTAVLTVVPSMITQTLYASNGTLYKSYDRARLVDKKNRPLKASRLKKHKDYIFMYPYTGTPVLLVDIAEATNRNVKLKSSDGKEYVFAGGVGKKKSIVAVSAICTHQLTHPTKNESFFNYVPKKKKTMSISNKKNGVFVCTTHLSAFDPKNGMKVVGGPASEAAASIILEVDKNDHIWAVGVLGNDRFHQFFKNFKSELKDSFGNWRKGKKLVKLKANTKFLTKYTKDIIIA